MITVDAGVLMPADTAVVAASTFTWPSFARNARSKTTRSSRLLAVRRSHRAPLAAVGLQRGSSRSRAHALPFLSRKTITRSSGFFAKSERTSDTITSCFPGFCLRWTIACGGINSSNWPWPAASTYSNDPARSIALDERDGPVGAEQLATA